MRIAEICEPPKPFFKGDKKAILALLEDLSLSYQEIAMRSGLSRERIRQIDLEFNYRTSKDRRLAMKSTVPARAMNDFETAAVERGMDVVVGWRRYATVNGKKCILSNAMKGRGPGKRYFTLNRSLRFADFLIYRIPAGFLILPAEKLKSQQTTIALHQPTGNRCGAYGHEHGWLEYINAWHLLEEK